MGFSECQKSGGAGGTAATQSSRRTTAVVPARFVSHLRVANRLRRLCPLGTRFPPVPAGVIGRREGARIQWMQLPKAASDWQPSTETRIWHGSAKDDD